MATKKSGWIRVKAVLAGGSLKDLLKLVGDLYRLSKDNRVFIESRFPAGEDALEHDKGIIADAVYPDVFKNKPIRLSVGKKAISDYKKATNDDGGHLGTDGPLPGTGQPSSRLITAISTNGSTPVWNPCWTASSKR